MQAETLPHGIQRLRSSRHTNLVAHVWSRMVSIGGSIKWVDCQIMGAITKPQTRSNDISGVPGSETLERSMFLFEYASGTLLIVSKYMT
jgi:hypothetical protein